MSQSTDSRVYPQMKDLLSLRQNANCFNILTKRRVRSRLTGNLRSVVRGRGLDFQEIRRYRPGDDIRLIDWRSTLRTGHANVRIFSDERDLPLIILLDLRASMFFGSEYQTKSASAATVAGLIVWHTVITGDRIGAVILGPDSLVEFAPGRAQHAPLRILRNIATTARQLDVRSPPDPDGTALGHAIAITEKLITHDHTIVVISDFINIQPRGITQLGKMTIHNEVFAIVIRDPLEVAFPASSDITVSNGSDRLTVDLQNLELRQKYAVHQDDAHTDLMSKLQGKGINTLDISSGRPVVAQVEKWNTVISEAQ